MNRVARNRVLLGPSGFITGFDIALDDKAVCRTDVGGAYREMPDGIWEQLIRFSSFPAGYVGHGSFVDENYYPKNTTDGWGCYEIVQAPSDSQRLYMGYGGYLWRSSDRGENFGLCNLPSHKMLANSGDQRLWNSHIAVHPSNPDVFVYGSIQNGCYSSSDGGTTMTTIAGVAAGTLNRGSSTGHLVAVNSVGNKWIISRYGTGLYEASSPNGPYALMSGAPAHPRYVWFDADDRLWVIDNVVATDNVYCLSNKVWTQVFHPGSIQIYGLAVDPLNTNDLTLFAETGASVRSKDRGATWIGDDVWQGTVPGPIGIYRYSPHVPYLEGSVAMFISRALWKRTGQRRLKMAEGVGLAECTPPDTFARWDWHTQSLGIEELGVTDVLTLPPGGTTDVFVGTLDKPILRHTDPSDYPLEMQHPGPTMNVDHQWGFDHASDDYSYLVCNVSYNQDASGYSDDGGLTWQNFSPMPNSNIVANCYGGGIACNQKGHVLIYFGNNAGPPLESGVDDPRVGAEMLIDGVWGPCTIGGTSIGNLQHAMFLTKKIATADKTVPGVFYLLVRSDGTASHAPGLYKNVAGGREFVKIGDTLHAGSFDFWNNRLDCIPGRTRELLYTCGGGYKSSPFYHIVDNNDGTITKNAIRKVTDVVSFGYGKGESDTDYPAIYIVGKVSGIWGNHVSFDGGKSWRFLVDYLGDNPFPPTVIRGHMGIYGEYFVNATGNGLMRGNIAAQKPSRRGETKARP
jgi:hypothetical protein